VPEQVDARAERGVGGHGLVDAAVDPGVFELQREAEPADATADHRHIQFQLTGT
jgi:hypothetical protein